MVEVGDKVRITKGAWKGHEGIVSRIDKRDMQVTVDGFDYPARVALRSVEKV